MVLDLLVPVFSCCCMDPGATFVSAIRLRIPANSCINSMRWPQDREQNQQSVLSPSYFRASDNYKNDSRV